MKQKLEETKAKVEVVVSDVKKLGKDADTVDTVGVETTQRKLEEKPDRWQFGVKCRFFGDPETTIFFNVTGTKLHASGFYKDGLLEMRGTKKEGGYFDIVIRSQQDGEIPGKFRWDGHEPKFRRISGKPEPGEPKEITFRRIVGKEREKALQDFEAKLRAQYKRLLECSVRGFSIRVQR